MFYGSYPAKSLGYRIDYAYIILGILTFFGSLLIILKRYKLLIIFPSYFGYRKILGMINFLKPALSINSVNASDEFNVLVPC